MRLMMRSRGCCGDRCLFGDVVEVIPTARFLASKPLDICQPNQNEQSTYR